MKIQLPENVSNIIQKLIEYGYEAYAVGGCVRDSILGRVPDDWDITTSAKPEDIKKLFKRTIDTGIEHGTVTVMLDREGFEVTTYRIDGEYEDSRHPRDVVFTENLVEDLKRRDFTINAMAYNDRAGLIDVFDGIGDIEKKVIRCVGNAEERFTEDALRIMRAICFSAQLGYAIAQDTRTAICKLAGNLAHISAERIQTELVKLLLSPHPDYLRIAYETGVTGVILPELDACMEVSQKNENHCYTVGEHILHSLTEVPPQKILRLTMLFHDLGKPVVRTIDEEGIMHFYGHQKVSADMTKKIMKRLRFDNDTMYKTTCLVEYHDYMTGVEPDKVRIRKCMNKVGEELYPLLHTVRRADILAQSEFRREEKLERLEKEIRLYEEIVADGQCVSLKTLAITGGDLIEAGMKPGKAMGTALQELLSHVLEHPQDNEKDILINILKKRNKLK